jgi:hypothetical protein
MAVTAKSRATRALRATTSITPGEALGAIRSAAAAVKGGGASMLTSGIANVGAQVHIEREQPNKLWLSIQSGKRLVELSTFTAEAQNADGRTTVRVGGLDSYKTVQSKFLGVVPTGPKAIHGIDLYKRYLTAVQNELLRLDPSAQVTIQGSD